MTSALTGISSMATRTILAELGRMYELRSGLQVTIQSMGGVDAARRVEAGEPADLVVLAAKPMARLEAAGHLAAGSCRPFALSRIAVAVPEGAKPPRLETEDDVRRAVLQAGRIGYSTGPSGDFLKQLWQDWGIADSIADRLVQAPAGVPVGSMLARGEADLGFQQLSELIEVPGIEVVGCLPPVTNAETIFAAGVGAKAPNAEAAQALLAFLTSPETEDVKRRHGMEPAQT